MPAEETLYVVDTYNHRICVHTPDGTFLRAFGVRGHGRGQFYFPAAASMSRSGAVLAVADSLNHRIQVLPRVGAIVWVIGAILWVFGAILWVFIAWMRWLSRGRLAQPSHPGLLFFFITLKPNVE